MTNNSEIFTVGHSTRSLEEFLNILNNFGIEVLVDVRRYPGSRRSPHFNKEKLKNSMPENGIFYHHFEDLGGRRKTNKNSTNTGWRLLSFRGYADFMETDIFRKAVKKLEEVARRSRVAYMCSETVWWSCHRALISDLLKLRGWKVTHLMAINKTMEHPYTKPAEIINGKLKYPENISKS
ncbi:DUF488 domain-containing protein [Salinimicrobium sp. CDJ15-81-2]|nr:DUF488 domain-containing protein [Salinimicrobium nanhaiense]